MRYDMRRAFVILLSLFSQFPNLAFGMDVPETLKTFVQQLESKQDSLQGGAITILVKGNVVYKKTFGNKKGQNDPITENTLFGLASLSKPVSAMAVGLMVENGQLNFDDKILLPYITNAITLNDILNHTTGYMLLGDVLIEKGMNRKQILASLQKQKTNCKPGKCYQYSNVMFSLIDEALKLKGSSINNAIINLSKTLKTQEITLLPIKPAENIAHPHSKKRILKFPSSYQKVVPASAGVFASINGMIEFFKLSFGYRPDLISSITLNRIMKPIQSNQDVFQWHLNFPFEEDKINSYYGLGWRIFKVEGNSSADLIFHSGYIKGARAFIGFVPSQEIGIIILSNDDTARFPLQSGMDFWGAVLQQ